MTRADKIFAIVLAIMCVLFLVVADIAFHVRHDRLPQGRCVSYFHCFGGKR